ncbi:hypothetical protein FQR65_LT20433 [Abscondita terminalis]|nr:hypothetical protein FQR65_LT20433 [Abscondita terminalis]
MASRSWGVAPRVLSARTTSVSWGEPGMLMMLPGSCLIWMSDFWATTVWPCEKGAGWLITGVELMVMARLPWAMAQGPSVTAWLGVSASASPGFGDHGAARSVLGGADTRRCGSVPVPVPTSWPRRWLMARTTLSAVWKSVEFRPSVMLSPSLSGVGTARSTWAPWGTRPALRWLICTWAPAEAPAPRAPGLPWASAIDSPSQAQRRCHHGCALSDLALPTEETTTSMAWPGWAKAGSSAAARCPSAPGVGQGLLGVGHLGGLVTRSIEADDQAVAGQLVAAHALHGSDLLDACCMRREGQHAGAEGDCGPQGARCLAQCQEHGQYFHAVHSPENQNGITFKKNCCFAFDERRVMEEDARASATPEFARARSVTFRCCCSYWVRSCAICGCPGQTSSDSTAMTASRHDTASMGPQKLVRLWRCLNQDHFAVAVQRESVATHADETAHSQDGTGGQLRVGP